MPEDRKHCWCKRCLASYDRKRYNSLNGRERERKRKNKARLIDAKKTAINNIKLKSGCVDCGYKKTAVALQFDHIDGTKEFNIGDGVKRGLSLSTMLSEVAKCEVRCANCHAEVTEQRRSRGSR